MKGQDVIFSNNSDEWKTPRWLLTFINRHFKISLDPCCTVFNVRAKKHYTIKEDGLKQKWISWTFVNPPYSQAYKWMEKAYNEYKGGINIICLIFAKTETRFFQQFAFKSNYILFINKRLKFYGNKRSKRDVAPFGSALVIFGKLNRYQHKALKKIGKLIKLDGKKNT